MIVTWVVIVAGGWVIVTNEFSDAWVMDEGELAVTGSTLQLSIAD